MAVRLLAPRLLIVALCWLLPSHGSAQTDPLTEAKILNEQIGKLYRQGSYAAAVPVAERVLEIREKDPSIGRAEALRRAEMAMLDPSNPPEFSHPLSWAPFVLAGEGGAGR
jgi:hypothetical protein